MAERVVIKFVCSVCREENYTLRRGKKSKAKGGGEKLQIQKFCARCRKHTMHREKR